MYVNFLIYNPLNKRWYNLQIESKTEGESLVSLWEQSSEAFHDLASKYNYDTIKFRLWNIQENNTLLSYLKHPLKWRTSLRKRFLGGSL